MALTQVNRGTSPNDNTASTLYDAFGVVNANASSLDTTIATSQDSSFNSVKVGKGGGSISGNTAVGSLSLDSNTTGQYNTAVGYSALNKNQNGTSNTALGINALELNVSGAYNTAIGFVALQNSSGDQNTAVGSGSLNQNTTGNNNTAIGSGACNKTKSGVLNTAIGSQAMLNNDGGSSCVAVGVNALLNQVALGNNTAVGVGALSSNTLFNSCTGLGADAQVTADNQLQLGNVNTIVLTQQAVQLRSDERDKTEIRDTVLGLDFINELRPVDYKWDMREDYKTEMPTQGELSDEDFKIVMDEWIESVKLDNLTHDGTHTRTRYHHGLIAQEVQDVIVASGVDFGGFQDHSIAGGQDVLSIGYEELIAPMIKAIQELTARINVLENN